MQTALFIFSAVLIFVALVFGIVWATFDTKNEETGVEDEDRVKTKKTYLIAALSFFLGGVILGMITLVWKAQSDKQRVPDMLRAEATQVYPRV